MRKTIHTFYAFEGHRDLVELAIKQIVNGHTLTTLGAPWLTGNMREQKEIRVEKITFLPKACKPHWACVHAHTH